MRIVDIARSLNGHIMMNKCNEMNRAYDINEVESPMKTKRDENEERGSRDECTEA